MLSFKKLYKYFTGFNLLLVFASTQAQTDSLRTYLELAEKNNPTVLQRFSEYQAALQKIPQVGSLPDPELNVGVFLSPMELVSGNQVADIRLMQMFPWFGVLKNARDEMSLMAKAKYESFVDAGLQVSYDVQRTWLELCKIKQDVRISEKNFSILQTLERLALVRFKAADSDGGNAAQASDNSGGPSQNNTSGSSGMQTMGNNQTGNSKTTSSRSPGAMQTNTMASSSGSASLVDLYKIQMELGETDNNIALLKNQMNTVLARFNNYLNRPVNSSVALPDTLLPDTLHIALTSLSDSVRINNPMTRMLQYEQQSFDARKKMVTRMGYPMVGIGVNYTLINKSEMSTSPMNGNDMIMPMVTVTLPIYRKKNRAMQTEATLMQAATSKSVNAASNALQSEYYEAMQLYQDALRRMLLYKNQCQLADKSLTMIIKSFATSGTGLNEVLRSRQQMLDYGFKEIEAVVDLNTSIALLNRLGNIKSSQQTY